MLSKFHVAKLLSCSASQRKTDLYVASSCYLCNSFCTVTKPPERNESPEIPSWVKFLDDKSHGSPDADDNFVIPSLASWVESYGPYGRIEVAKVTSSDIEEINVEKVCKLLRNRYSSPDSVVAALNASGVGSSSSMIERILKKFNNDWIPAFGVFTWAKLQMGHHHPSVLCDLMVDILGKSSKFHLMWNLVEEMKIVEGYVTLATMSKVIRRLARAGKYQDAIDAFKEIEQFGVKRDIAAMNVLMDALAKENSVEHAREVFLQFKSSIPCDIHSYNILIHGYCKCKQFDNARKILEEMEQQGFEPNVISYTCFVEWYCREQDFHKVNAILDEMKKKGCSPNTVTYTTLMQGLGKAKQLNDALEVYENMKSFGCAPDPSFYSSLIYILSKAGRFKDAWAVYEDMGTQGVKPDLLTFNTVIAAACTCSREETALKILKKMEEDSCKPDLKTYASLIKMCCRKKRMKVLQFLLNHMLKNDVSIEVSTYSLLVRGLCKSGKLEEACLFFEEMVLRGIVPWETTCKMLVQKLDGMSMGKQKEHIEKLMSVAKKGEKI
ncbi:pentatricopeptide repeat-containing protein At3g22670, mitochondrial [Rhodamnia argentea]|uniref:Pentatricopeptide repeat-containing protein At3g22670, mitochondrial n=1 Tax=Rhodamnia argentea TaxID=178133 RepID=A0A8B8Q8L2_9MYRT|nr:pentatricopeptide repeat-containing protein At3g22670, mitochondrial [Rhodamnia argentea]